MTNPRVLAMVMAVGECTRLHPPTAADGVSVVPKGVHFRGPFHH